MFKKIKNNVEEQRYLFGVIMEKNGGSSKV